MSLMQEGLDFPLGLFFRGVGTHALGTVPTNYQLPLSQGVLVRFLRFRLACYHLRLNRGTWVQPPVPHISESVCLVTPHV
jgi:hypothetical protein